MSRPLSPAEYSEVHRLQQELEALSERFDEERLEWRAQIDRLKMESEALRRLLGRRDPQFASEFQDSFEDLRQVFDPEQRSA